MYTPPCNRVSDRATLLEAMRAIPLAILFGAGTSGGADETTAATHLPLLVKDEGEHGTLLGHFARANSHWSALSGRETLVVFPGPHSYVTPALYSKELSVPTWNYIAIHAYGILTPIEDEDARNQLLEELIQEHDPGYIERWRKMPGSLRRTMLSGIVGFRIPIARIEGKFKLSQNRTPEERCAIQAAHAAGDANQQELARWMGRLAQDSEAKRY